MKNSIVGHNSGVLGTDCAGDVSRIHPFGDNFHTDGSCGLSFFLENPLLWLGPLANNGGMARTHALLPSSPAIDLAIDCTSLAGAAVIIDQRGISRPQDAACDVGAYERLGKSLMAADDVYRILGTVETTIGARLTTMFHNVVRRLSDRNADNDRGACANLTAFLHRIQTLERRAELTRDQTAALRRATQVFQQSAGCGP